MGGARPLRGPLTGCATWIGSVLALATMPGLAPVSMGVVRRAAVSLLSLLVAALVGGLLMVRMVGGSSSSPSRPPQPAPQQRVEQVERAVEAAGQADQQRLDDAMKGLR